MTRSILATAMVAGAGITALYWMAPGTTPIASAAPASTGIDAAHPAVIELYQSQGCSSCPPALAVLDRIAARPDVLALNFAVTYWDQLGWKDTYAQPAFTARQWDYSRAQGRTNVQTPQLIVNGRATVLGSNRAEVEKAIGTYRRAPGPDIRVTAGQVSVSQGMARPSTVWLATYDPRRIDVPVGAGENSGRTLPHRNIVRSLVALGNWNGSATHYTLPAPREGLARAVLIQAGKGGPIVAAGRI